MDNSQADNYQADDSHADNSQIDNEGFLDLLNVGSSELNWSGTQYCSPIGEQETMSTPDVSVSVKARSSRTGSTKGKNCIKGKNWSSAEDEVLIQAWGNTSMDAVIGTDQNSNTYWGRIADYYKANKQPSWSERNANALNCRFTAISTSTSRFCGCIQQIINKNESGRTIDEKVCIYLLILFYILHVLSAGFNNVFLIAAK
jgi:hypothetical protein